MRTLSEKIDDLKIKLEAENISGVHEFDGWEQSFLTSVCQQVADRSVHSLSEKQMSKIHDIYDKYF